ncbi:MAG: NADH-quinone oxidoreductase subunit C [Burkholderiaceae bacterium]|nr:NADH-quinone oxidoreductase subunit C [Burkholderiaceae bacterium]
MPATRLETLEAALRASLGDSIRSLVERLGEITVVIDAASHAQVAERLRDEPALRFDTLIDLCGVDYRDYGEGTWSGARFAVVMHLLSVAHNWRVRVRTFCADDDMPMVASVTGVWPVANWFEREAFDLFGIVFDGHGDLRRILTDYGFVGHPFRKDFPISGYVEMRYDPEQKRVVYQPVTIEPREVVPRILRDDRYGVERPDVGLRGQK